MLPRAKKSFGQNFLHDQSVVAKIISAADIVRGETVLEIGPGTGTLTQALVDAGAQVVAVEADHDLIQPLKETFGDRITLIEGDALSVRLPLATGQFKLIANIPYNITSPILEKFLAHEPQPTRMVLMVQREVADRITAKPPEMGLLSVVCQIYATVTKVANVPAGAFRPIPKVDSAVVRLDIRASDMGAEGQGSRRPERSPADSRGRSEDGGMSRSRGPMSDPERVIALAKAGFSHPRKQLHGNLAASGRGTSEKIKEALVATGLDPKIRAEALTVGDWISLESRLRI